MSVEQNLERNVVDDDDKGDLVRYASIQEMFAISFTRSPMQFVNPVFFVPLVAGAILKEQIDIRSTKLYLLTM